MEYGVIKAKRLHEAAKLPVRGSEGAAGLDLHTIESVTIWPGKRALLRTGIALEIPYGFVGLIWPRSKLAAKMGIDSLAGVCDSDFRGEVRISLQNHGEDAVELRQGDKVAQILIQPIWMGSVEEVDTLSSTDRGSSGITCSDMRLK